MQEPQYIEIDEEGNKFYYKDKKMDIIHRVDGPAVEWSNGDKEWYVDGHRHREDGPAAEFSGDKLWYLNDIPMGEEEFNKRTKKTVLTMDEIAAKFGIDVSKLKITK